MKHFIAITLLLLAAGCGNNVRVSGKVLFEDGKPVTRGTVRIESSTGGYSGHIKSDGSYSVGNTRDGQGIPPGTYKVYLTGSERFESVYNSAGEATNDDVVFPQVVTKFCNSRETPLTLEVKSGGAITYDIQVERHPDWDKQQKYKPKGK
jgi:hypothetical protein